MDAQEKRSVLEKYYYKSVNPGAFAGPEKLFDVLNKIYPNQYTRQFIRTWLNDQDAYSLQKPVRHRFRTAKVRVTKINEQWDIDLLSMANLAKNNDGVHYLLCVIDIFSRRLWVKPLRNKTAKAVLDAIKPLLAQEKPHKIRSDKGSEFVRLRSYAKEKGIYYFTTNNLPKANYVERVQRTIKMYIYRMMRHQRTFRYIDDLDNIVLNYNTTPHRSLGGFAPNDVTKRNEADVWAYQYLKPSKSDKANKPVFHLKRGDLVRISFTKQPFRRAYQEQYTTEVYKVSQRFLKQGIPMYKLKDLRGLDIQGNFYSVELQKVNKDENSLWFIEDIIKKRRRNKKLQYLVKWSGYSDDYNSWINADEVKDTSATSVTT